MVNAIISLADKCQKHGCIDQIDEVFNNNIEVAEHNAGLALASHEQHRLARPEAKQARTHEAQRDASLHHPNQY